MATPTISKSKKETADSSESDSIITAVSLFAGCGGLDLGFLGGFSYKGTRYKDWAIGDLEHVSDESVPNQSQYFRASRAKRGNGQGDETSRAGEPSYTVRANAKSRVQFHYKLDRRLTVRECARLQTFPDNFRFPHSGTTNIMQIGNAVPPMLGYKVAQSVVDYLIFGKR